MGPFRKLLLVAVSASALYGVSACTTDTDLNPQPLPPRNEERAPPSAGGFENSDGKSPTGATQDAGTDGGDGGDASDAGDR